MGRSGRMCKISSTQGFDPRTVQVVASRYTISAIPARCSVYHMPHHTDVLHIACHTIQIFYIWRGTPYRCSAYGVPHYTDVMRMAFKLYRYCAYRVPKLYVCTILKNIIRKILYYITVITLACSPWCNNWCNIFYLQRLTKWHPSAWHTLYRTLRMHVSVTSTVQPVTCRYYTEGGKEARGFSSNHSWTPRQMGVGGYCHTLTTLLPRKSFDTNWTWGLVLTRDGLKGYDKHYRHCVSNPRPPRL